MSRCAAFLMASALGIAACASPSPVMYKGRAFDQILLRKSQVTGCYLAVPPPRNEGGFDAVFTIGSEGKVTEANVKNSTLQNPNVEKCVINLLKSIPFEAPLNKGSAELKFPFSFKSD